MKFLSLTLVIIVNYIFVLNAASQEFEPLQGRMAYSIKAQDTSMQKLIPASLMIVYTNDTIVRIENESQLGPQVLIKHFEFNKSYLLLSIGEDNYAIQTDYSKSQTQKESKYTYKKKWGKRKIAGLKAKRMLVSHPDFDKPVEFLYLKNYSPKYLDAFPDFPGLPVKYYLPSPDGVLEYSLQYLEQTSIDKTFFGIPTDHEKVTFDQFLEIYLEQKQ